MVNLRLKKKIQVCLKTSICSVCHSLIIIQYNPEHPNIHGLKKIISYRSTKTKEIDYKLSKTEKISAIPMHQEKWEW